MNLAETLAWIGQAMRETDLQIEHCVAFDRPALSRVGRPFAFVDGEGVVVTLPRARITELTRAETARRWTHGPPEAEEWVLIEAPDLATMTSFVLEARDHAEAA